MQNQLWQPFDTSEIDGLGAALPKWLSEHMSEGMKWLLVHADDGVIWGRLDADGTIALSSQIVAFQPRFPSLQCELRAETIQQLRIFGTAGELLIWRKDNLFPGRIIKDLETLSDSFWDEQYLLWGQGVIQDTGFTVLEEGRRGPVHAIPIKVPVDARAALTVRHYAAFEASAMANVSMSRLVDLVLYRDKKEK